MGFVRKYVDLTPFQGPKLPFLQAGWRLQRHAKFISKYIAKGLQQDPAESSGKGLNSSLLIRELNSESVKPTYRQKLRAQQPVLVPDFEVLQGHDV